MTKEETVEILMDYIKGSGCLVFKATGLPNEIKEINSMLSEIPKYSNVAKFSKAWIGKKLSFSLVEIDRVETLEIVLDTWSRITNS